MSRLPFLRRQNDIDGAMPPAVFFQRFTRQILSPAKHVRARYAEPPRHKDRRAAQRAAAAHAAMPSRHVIAEGFDKMPQRHVVTLPPMRDAHRAATRPRIAPRVHVCLIRFPLRRTNRHFLPRFSFSAAVDASVRCAYAFRAMRLPTPPRPRREHFSPPLRRQRYAMSCHAAARRRHDAYITRHVITCSSCRRSSAL